MAWESDSESDLDYPDADYDTLRKGYTIQSKDACEVEFSLQLHFSKL